MYKIITRLHGGLGNQLFQILAVRYLAQLKNIDFIKIYAKDIDKFKTKRFLEIEPLLRTEEIIDNIGIVDNFLFTSKISKLLSHVNIHSISYVDCFDKWKGQYLNGYFQEIYNYQDYSLLNNIVSDIEGNLKKLNTETFIFNSNIKAYGAIHLRLTDFINGAKSYKFLKEFRLPYIFRATEFFKKNFNIKKFVVFTDDITLAKSLLNGEEFLFFKDLPNSNLKLLEEFYLLSSFPYLITSNSTFSYWSSLFGTEKTIIFPSIWNDDDEKENFIFKKNIENHSKMFPRNNHILVV